MVNYGLQDRVVVITGANNPQGIGAATSLAFAREGAKVVLVYKKVPRVYDRTKTDKNGADRYFQANASNADAVEDSRWKWRSMVLPSIVLHRVPPRQAGLTRSSKKPSSRSSPWGS